MAEGLLGDERSQELGRASVNGGVPHPGKRLLSLPSVLIQGALIFASRGNKQDFYGHLFPSLPLFWSLKGLLGWLPGSRGAGWGCWAGGPGEEVLRARGAAPISPAQLEKTQTGVGPGAVETGKEKENQV